MCLLTQKFLSLFIIIDNETAHRVILMQKTKVIRVKQ